MATAVGDLVVNLTANTGKFQKKMGGARSAISGFVTSVGSGIARLGVFGAALAGAAGIGSISLLVNNSLKSVDAIAKLSAQIGASTEDISGLGFAAEQSGASQETMNSSLQRMTRRIGLFAEGSGAAKMALERLGFAAEDLTSLSAGDQFREIAARIAELPTAAARGAAAFEIFGRSGQELLPLINQGPAGIKALTDEAERLGITFSNADASKIEAANDAMNRVKRSIEGAANELTIALAPAIESVANWVGETLVPAFRAVPDVIAELGFAFDNFGTSAQIALLDIVTSGLKTLPQLEGPIAHIAALFTGSWAGIKAFFGTLIDGMIGSLMELKNVAVAIAAGITAAFQSIKSGDLAGAGGAFGDAFIKTLANQDGFKGPTDAFAEFGKAFEDARKQTLDTFEQSGGLTGYLDDQKAELERQLAERAAAFQKMREEQAAQESVGTGSGTGETGGEGGQSDPQLLSGTAAGTKEAFDKILQAGLNKPDDVAKQQVNHLKKIEEQQKKLLDETKKQNQQRQNEVVIGALD